MKKKIYYIQPTYRDRTGKLLKGKKLYILSLALPALSAITPLEWEKEFCYEYLDEINFETDASVIGISSMGYEIFRGIEIADEFRKRGKVVIFGGFQPQIIRSFVGEHCDSVVYGNPGKSDMLKILQDIESNKPEINYFCKIDINYKFDYSVIDTNKLMFTSVLTSVGCFNSCDFCCVGAVYKGKYRLRNFNYVMEELEELRKSTKKIAFIDTNIYNNRKFLIKVCKEMIIRKFGFIWGAEATVDIGDDVEALDLIKKAGCRILYMGMETIDQNNLDSSNKKYSIDSYQQKIKNIHNAGIKIGGFFMYGMDEDTKETAKNMSKFIKENKIAIPMLNIFVPTPGTRMYERMKNDNRLLVQREQDYLKNNITYNSSFNLCLYTPKNMTPVEVEEGFIELLGKLSGLVQILTRSISKSFFLTLFLLYANWTFRKEYLALKKTKK